MSKKGFQSFVSSILNDTKKQNNQNYQVRPKNKNEKLNDQKNEQVMNEDGDIGLLKLINNQEQGNDIQSKNEPQVKGLGLGYDKHINQSEKQAMFQMQKLKKQINNSQKDDNKNNDQINKGKQDEEEHSKFGINKKQRGVEVKQEIMQQKRDQKQIKKSKQKEKKQKQEQSEKQEQNQNQIEEQEKQDSQDQENTTKKRKYREVKGGRMRRRTKTRSKQKNLRKDTRPIDEKKQKLANKGITI